MEDTADATERRAAPREPAREPLRVVLRRPHSREACEGEARDLSVAGLGVSVPSEEAGALEFAVRVEVALALPGEPHPIALDGTIRRRSLRPGTTFFGIELDGEASRGWSRARDAIRAYAASLAAAA